MQIVDTHCHLDEEGFANELDEVVAAAVENGASDPSETAPVESEASPEAPPVASAAASGVTRDTAEAAEPTSPTPEEPAPVDTEATSGEAL